MRTTRHLDETDVEMTKNDEPKGTEGEKELENHIVFCHFEFSNHKWHKMAAIQCDIEYYLFNSLAEIIWFHGILCKMFIWRGRRQIGRHNEAPWTLYTFKRTQNTYQKCLYTAPLTIIVIMSTMIAMFLSNIWPWRSLRSASILTPIPLWNMNAISHYSENAWNQNTRNLFVVMNKNRL